MCPPSPDTTAAARRWSSTRFTCIASQTQSSIVNTIAVRRLNRSHVRRLALLFVPIPGQYIGVPTTKQPRASTARNTPNPAALAATMPSTSSAFSSGSRPSILRHRPVPPVAKFAAENGRAMCYAGSPPLRASFFGNSTVDPCPSLDGLRYRCAPAALAGTMLIAPRKAPTKTCPLVSPSEDFALSTPSPVPTPPKEAPRCRR